MLFAHLRCSGTLLGAVVGGLSLGIHVDFNDGLHLWHRGVLDAPSVRMPLSWTPVSSPEHHVFQAAAAGVGEEYGIQDLDEAVVGWGSVGRIDLIVVAFVA